MSSSYIYSDSLGPMHATESGFISPQVRAAKAAKLKASAERRVNEAEQRLRLAIEALRESQKAGDSSSAFFSARHCLCEHGDSCIANAVGSLCQSFLLAYGIRVGIGVLLRAFKLLRNKPVHSILDLQLLLSEKNLIVREEACRNGLLFGGFTGLYHGTRCLLRRMRGRETPINPMVAGCVAGMSALALDDSSKRRSFALYLLARVGQCAYNSAKENRKFHLWGSQWGGGNTLLFALSSAQIMYAYVMRPETLPPSYHDFIVRTGPMPLPIVTACRNSCRKEPLNLTSLRTFLQSKSKSLPPNFLASSPLVPCAIMHPGRATCAAQNLDAMKDTFRKTFPLYMSLTLVPFAILNLHKFMQSPVQTLLTATKGAVRSTCFISLFVGIYQAVICFQRRSMTRDHKMVYWAAGLCAGLSALIEKSGRRSELALYTLPRAADSLWYILVHRHLLPDIKYAEVALFSLCMGGLMYYHEYEPQTMAPFLRGILTRFKSRTGFPLSDSGLGALISPGSYNNSHTLALKGGEKGGETMEMDVVEEGEEGRKRSVSPSDGDIVGGLAGS